jgi:hypothetical protein
MPMNFPDAPSEGAIFTGPNGLQYIYQNGVWMQSSAAQIKALARSERNIIVNPSFLVSQENGTAIGTAHNYYFADQWALQGVGIPMGGRVNFDNTRYAGMIYNTAVDTPAAGDFLVMTHPIEGMEFMALGWGSPQAVNGIPPKPAVLNFKAKVAVAGTYSGVLKGQGGTPAQAFPFNFTIAAGDVNVWKEFTIPIPVPPASTNFSDLGFGLGGLLQFAHTLGSTFVAPTEKTWQTGNFFGATGVTNNSAVINSFLWIADVQLLPDPDASGAAPSFIIPSYADELARCQRYWQKDFTDAIIFGGAAQGSGTWYGDVQYPVAMRAIPTVAVSGGAGANVNSPAFSQAGIFGFRWFIIAQAAGSFFIVVRHISNARLF